MVSTIQPSVLPSATRDEDVEDDEKLVASVIPFLPSTATRNVISTLLQTYRVEETAAKIRGSGYSRIALQFPDEYLHDAPAICAALGAQLGDSALVFMLGDTSYGACCADEIAAQHLDAEAIVHYGHACLSPTRALPVLHVFPQCGTTGRVDAMRRAIDAVSDAVPDVGRIVVMYDLELAALVHDAGLGSGGDGVGSVRIDVAEVRVDDLLDFVPPQQGCAGRMQNSFGTDDESEWVEVGALRFSKTALPLSDTAVVWLSNDVGAVGDAPSPALRNAALLLATGLTGTCRVMYREGLDGNIERVDGSRLLRLRAREVGRVREAERIGVVAGSLAVAGVTEAIDRVVRIIEEAGKRAYVILVGKISPPKLLNFEEMDAFVVVACPLRVIMDSKEFSVPVVTPFEIDVALSGRELYEGLYIADFRQVGNDEECAEEDVLEDELRLVKRAELKVAVSDVGGAAAFYKERTWKGLVRDKGGRDEDTGVDELSTDVVRGSCGMATRYDRETGR